MNKKDFCIWKNIKKNVYKTDCKHEWKNGKTDFCPFCGGKVIIN
jgi:hypothetical protein